MQYTTRYDAENALRNMMNATIPEVLELLKKGFKRKDNGEFFKKTHDAVREILTKYEKEFNGRAFINNGYGMLRIEFKTTWYKGTALCNHTYYHESSWYLFEGEALRDYQPQKTFTPKECDDASLEMLELSKQIKALKEKQRAIRFDFGDYIAEKGE